MPTLLQEFLLAALRGVLLGLLVSEAILRICPLLCFRLCKACLQAGTVAADLLEHTLTFLGYKLNGAMEKAVTAADAAPPGEHSLFAHKGWSLDNMASRSCGALVQRLPLEVLTHVFRQLDLHDLVRVALICKLFRHGGLETVELPTESPVATVLLERAFSRLELAPRMRSATCSDTWVTYLARCVRRRCREAPLIAAGMSTSMFEDGTGRLLACGWLVTADQGNQHGGFRFDPAPVAAMVGIRVRSMAAGDEHSLALGWDGRVYSWGVEDSFGQMGQGHALAVPLPTPKLGLESVHGIAAATKCGLAATQSGAVFSWGRAPSPKDKDVESGDVDDLENASRVRRPTIVEGFGGVDVRRVCAGDRTCIGEAGELFSWGIGQYGRLGHDDAEYQPLPKRVEALQGVRVSSVAVGPWHALALAEDGLMYAWGENMERALLDNPDVESELLPKPVKALRGVRVGNIPPRCRAATQFSTPASCGGTTATGLASLRSAMASRCMASCPNRLSRFVVSRWMRWPPAWVIPWRSQATEVYTRGATCVQRNGACLAWAQQWELRRRRCTRRSASQRCVRQMAFDHRALLSPHLSTRCPCMRMPG